LRLQLASNVWQLLVVGGDERAGPPCTAAAGSQHAAGAAVPFHTEHISPATSRSCQAAIMAHHGLLSCLPAGPPCWSPLLALPAADILQQRQPLRGWHNLVAFCQWQSSAAGWEVTVRLSSAITRASLRLGVVAQWTAEQLRQQGLWHRCIHSPQIEAPWVHSLSLKQQALLC